MKKPSCVPESIMVRIVSRFELDVHEIAGADGWCEEEDLHGRVVGRDEAREQVQVAADEHHRKQDLSTA